MRPLLVFDNDGTLHETLQIYVPAVRKGVSYLQEHGYQDLAQPPVAQITRWIGMNLHEMWADFFPALPEEQKLFTGRLIGRSMIEELQAGGGKWFDGVEEMLRCLRDAGFALAILSNCGVDYARAHWERFDMARYFAAFFTCETYHEAPKSEILCEIARDPKAAVQREPVHNPEALAGEAMQLVGMAGDRASDLAAAQAARVPFAACLYGYGQGELERCQGQTQVTAVRDPREIPAVFGVA